MYFIKSRELKGEVPYQISCYLVAISQELFKENIPNSNDKPCLNY